MSLRVQTVVFDCSDTLLVASFWSEVLGLPVQELEDGDLGLEPGGNKPDLLFQQVPEGKSVKNRLHLDVRPDDQDATVERLISLGARRTDIGQGDVSWVVMADPEGNEFCVLRPDPVA
ncbi:MAG: VOC family protein [Candidatus Dormiibacterota bacterium]